jgi:hypothetical protein
VTAVVALAGAGALIEGWAAYLATPLLVLAAVCVGLWFAGTLGDSDDDSEEETLH